MEAPPPPPSHHHHLSAPVPTAYPDSIDSSPHSRHTDCWDIDPPPPPQKLRLMCSYGGHIVPRPHDKTLCYIGGDTRIIVIDRHTSLADLHHRLSKTLLHNQTFSLKYQLPNEDLDSLISVTTDEDLENMVEEYDRLHNSGSGGLKPGRLRLFLFPKSSSNIEQLLVETASTKSDDWFFNALNGKSSNLSTGASDRGFSESSSVNCLLGLDDDSVGKASGAAAAAATSGKDPDPQIDGSKHGNGGNTVANHDVHSVPDSPMIETTSSFGSTSSSPSVANLPPIRVKVEENPKIGEGMGIEDRFQQMTLGLAGNVNLAPPPEVGGFVAAGVEAGTVVSAVPVVLGGDYAANRVISDDERSDHGGHRKVQQSQPQVQVLQGQQIPQFQIKQTGAAVDLASPDSVSSDGSLTNQLSRQRHHAMYQESIIQMVSGNPRFTGELKPGDQNNSKIQMQTQVQESGYVLPGQFDQAHSQLHPHPQQFVHAGNQFIPTGAVPVAPYYSYYPHQQPQNPPQPMLDQQYPIYYVSTRPTQGYNLPVHQPSYGELSQTAPSSRPQTPPASALTSHAGYPQAINIPSSKPEMASGVYRTAIGGTTQLVQIPSSQHQPQYVGFTQVHHPGHSMAPSSAAISNYDFVDPTQAQMYYAQQLPPQLPAQYDTLTSAPGTGIMLPDASPQFSTENIKQQVRNLP